MNTSFAQLKADAREHLTGRYGSIVVPYMMAQLITSLPSLFVSSSGISNELIGILIDFSVSIIVVLLEGIFIVGQNYICLKNARIKGTSHINVNDMWYGFKGLADSIIKVVFRIYVIILIPAIPLMVCIYYCAIKPSLPLIFACIFMGAYVIFRIIRVELTFSQVLFLIVDHPDYDTTQLMKTSLELMKGNMMKLFLLQLSFIGYYLLCLLSLGIGFYWIMPYKRMTCCEFYLHLIGEVEEEIILEGDPSDPNYFKEVY